MYEEIRERIVAIVVFKNGRALPYSFSWRGRRYQVDNINLERQEQRGKARLFCFSVTASGNTYELSFDSQNLIWTLEKIWSCT